MSTKHSAILLMVTARKPRLVTASFFYETPTKPLWKLVRSLDSLSDHERACIRTVFAHLMGLEHHQYPTIISAAQGFAQSSPNVQLFDFLGGRQLETQGARLDHGRVAVFQLFI